MDLEPLYHLLRHEWPVHSKLHTFIGGLVVGIAAAICTTMARGMLERFPSGFHKLIESSPLPIQSELTGFSVWSGGLIGGISHPLLDALMHEDVRPFAPWTDRNPFLGMIGPESVHFLCVAAGVLGVALIGRGAYSRKRKDEI